MTISKNQIYAGTVTKITDFGILVAIAGERHVGLVHVSQLMGNSADLQKARLRSVEVGAAVFVEVLDIKKEGRLTKLSLSEKSVHNTQVLRYIPLNEEIIGVVTSKKEYGAFMELSGWHVSGLLHAMRMVGDTRYERDSVLDGLEVGERVPVYVIEIEVVDDNLRLTLSQTKQGDDFAVVATGTDENGAEVEIDLAAKL
ncbi:S1 RNA-binding domain-containing protein [bacterium]|nr:S1 RNA-binding domain-containing protein [bacterium]MBP9810538.1 S1 RNA-binding domain-containing protein [bacterium]